MQSIISAKNNFWRSYFLSKHSKFYVDLGNLEKNSENVFWFWGNSIWIGSVKHSLSLREREYLSLGVNILTTNFKISNTTKMEFFDLIFFQSNQKIWQKYCHADFCSVSDPLTCWLSISVLTQDFFGIWVTRLLAVYNFRNK